MRKLKTIHRVVVEGPPPESITSYSCREITGDLFNSPAYDSLAHCVSRDFSMGKGIAAEFKKNYGGVEELRDQKKNVGQAAVLRRGQRWLYYLITKGRFWDRPTYESLRLSLADLKQHVVENNVKTLSMPKIGCGLDRLQWSEVKKIIDETFKDVAIMISVYTFEPPGSRRRVVEEEKTDATTEPTAEVKTEAKTEVTTEIKTEARTEVKTETKTEVKTTEKIAAEQTQSTQS